MSKTDANYMEYLSALFPTERGTSDLDAMAQALAGLSPEDRDLLTAVKESPYRLTTLEQFREFPANTEYFVLESNISKVEDVGWRYLAQHSDILLPPELLDVIDPISFSYHAIQEEQGWGMRNGSVGFGKARTSLPSRRSPRSWATYEPEQEMAFGMGVLLRREQQMPV